MKKLLERIRSISLPWYFDMILIFLVGILAYGLTLPKLGYYWDDWGFLWMANHLGHAEMVRYFFDSKVYEIFVEFTTSILGTKPLVWQIFGFLTRYISAITFWWLIRLIWPSLKKYALWGALLFLVFPGFWMQSIAINIGHFFLFISFFLFSFCFNALAIQRTRGYWVFTIIALIFSFLNLSAWEYFFTLELLRPFLIAFILNRESLSRRDFWKRWIIAWLPFLVLFVILTIWRAFFFPEQIVRYQFAIIESLKTNPFSAILQYLDAFFTGIYTAFIGGWIQTFRFPDIKILGLANFIRYGLVIAIAFIILMAFVLIGKYLSNNHERSTPKTFLQFVLLGAMGLLLAGIPFVLINNPVGLTFPNNRFIVPFIPGAVFLLIGLLGLLSLIRPLLQKISQIILIIIVAFSVGQQFKNGVSFITDWKVQQRLYWQLSWRIPALQPGTAIISNDFYFRFVTDNSITAPLNWIYAPDFHGGDLPYDFLFISLRLGNYLPDLKPGLLISHAYRPLQFVGNTSQIITIIYEPPGCLRILDPLLDQNNTRLIPLMRQAASLSSTSQIVPQGTPYLPLNIFGNEPTHNWCYYFEKADLARQQGNWAEVVQLGDKAFTLNDVPNDPSEIIPFIEGYAHTGNWARALELTQHSSDVTPLMQPVLCPLWQRIANQTISSDARTATMQQISQMLSCNIP